MNRNSLYLKIHSGGATPSEDYTRRRACLKRLETAYSSFDLTTKAWHATTVEMARTLELLCDALLAWEEVRDDTLVPAPIAAGAAAERIANVVASPVGLSAVNPEQGAEPQPSAPPPEEQHEEHDDGNNTDTVPSRPAGEHDHAQQEEAAACSSDDATIPEQYREARQRTQELRERMAAASDKMATAIQDTERRLAPVVSEAERSIISASELIQQQLLLPSRTMLEELQETRRVIANISHEFAVKVQQDIAAPFLTLAAELQSCEDLRHKRNRAQEQFDVDRIVLEKKIEGYEKKGKPLSESKKYTDLFVIKEHSHELFLQADSAFVAAYEKLMMSSNPTLHRQLARSFASVCAKTYSETANQLLRLAIAADK